MLLTLREIGILFCMPSVAFAAESVAGVSIDTRTLQKGELFFALQGKIVVHQYVDDAFAKGAAAAVVDVKYASESHNRRLIRTNDTLFALQKLATEVRGRFDIPVIAITGSNGKTSSKEMLASLLERKYRVFRTSGNLNNHIGVPLSILQWKKGTEIAVLEMGTNHFGEIHRLCEIADPTHGLLTNIGDAHLEYFGDRDGVMKAKTELLDYLRGGKIFYNGDDEMLSKVSGKYPDAIRFGLSEDCNVRAQRTGMDKRGCPWFEIDGMKIQLNVPGRHQVHNALGAIAVAGSVGGLDKHDIMTGLAAYHAYDRRLQMIELPDFTLLNDVYNSNPSSLRASLSTLKDIGGEGRTIAVLGDMLELGERSRGAHARIAEWMSSLKIDALFAYGAEMREAVTGNADFYREHFMNKEALIRELKEFIRPGDTILVKGSRSMRMEEVVTALTQQIERG